MMRYLLLSLCLLANTVALAQTVSSKGMGSFHFGFRVNADARQEALRLAQLSAIENYLAEVSPAKVRLFMERREALSAQIERFIVATTILSETTDKPSKTHSVVIRAEINAPLLSAELNAGSATQNTAPADRSLLTLLFVSRMQATSQSFDARIHKRVDGTAAATVGNGQSENTSEGERIGASRISTSGSRETSDSTTINTSSATTTGGSTLRKADQVTWTVTSAAEINSTMTGVFSSAGFEVVEAEYVEAESAGQLSVARVREAFSGGDDLGGEVLRSTVNGIRAAGIPLLALGTLDVGMQDIDPVSGNVRIPVTVTGKVLDVSGRFPRTLTSVGPVQFFGIGPDASVAKTNALTMAAEKAASRMVDELNIKNVR